MWDKGKYVLGLEENNKKYNDSFIELIRKIADLNPHDKSLLALLKFYALSNEIRIKAIRNDPMYEEIRRNFSAYFSFQLDGENKIIAEKSELFHKFINDYYSDGNTGVCLVTGNYGSIVRIASPTPILGSSPMASLVGFQVNSGYDSYGKTQGYNAPISVEAEFAYSSALKALLDKDSRNKFWVGDRVFLFWSNSSAGSEMEDIMFDLLDFDSDKNCDPNEKISHVEKVFKGIWSGEINTSLDDRFFTLGLAPNVGRIAVVEWSDAPLKEFAFFILQHFNDMEIIDTRAQEKRRPFTGLYAMIANVTLDGKPSNAPKSLVENTFSSIVKGTSYPFALYTSALDRIRADFNNGTVTPGRAAILKAYINRQYRNNPNIKQLTSMLDKTNDNPAYLCGRLAAVLEKIQDAAGNGDSIRTRYLAAASTTPATVFPAMMNLSVHHAGKLDNPGLKIHYESLKDQIVSLLPASGFPIRLDLSDQGRFFVGYHHQRADFYTKKTDK